MRERERETPARDVVVMDACPDCGGIWLDKGEMEKLSQSEDRYYQQARRDDRRRRDDGYDDDDDRRGFGFGGGPGRGGFLGTFFGGMGD